jgi:hypothetical protein
MFWLRWDWLREFMQPSRIEGLFDNPPAEYSDDHFRIFCEFKDALNRGLVRSAEPDTNSHGGWRTNAWVKKGILLGFRMGVIIDIPSTLPASRSSTSRLIQRVASLPPTAYASSLVSSSIRDGSAATTLCAPTLPQSRTKETPLMRASSSAFERSISVDPAINKVHVYRWEPSRDRACRLTANLVRDRFSRLQ